MHNKAKPFLTNIPRVYIILNSIKIEVLLFTDNNSFELLLYILHYYTKKSRLMNLSSYLLKNIDKMSVNQKLSTF